MNEKEIRIPYGKGQLMEYTEPFIAVYDQYTEDRLGRKTYTGKTQIEQYINGKDAQEKMINRLKTKGMKTTWIKFYKADTNTDELINYYVGSEIAEPVEIVETKRTRRSSVDKVWDDIMHLSIIDLKEIKDRINKMTI